MMTLSVGAADKLTAIRSALGEPFYENEFGLLYKGDCLEGLRRIPEGIVDATVTSPPYNIGKEYEEVQPVERFTEWLLAVLDEVAVRTKEHGALLLNVGYLEVEGVGRAVPIPYLIWNRTRFFLNQEIVWNYGAGVASKRYLSPRNEKILWFVKDKEVFTFNLDDIRDPDVKYPNQKKNGKLRCNTLGKNPSDVWQIAKVTSGSDRSSAERMNHPAQFPEDLVLRMIKGFTNNGEVVLDPFIGSGSTAAVAMRNGRGFLGFELDERYLHAAAQRLERVKAEIQSKAAIIKLFSEAEV